MTDKHKQKHANARVELSARAGAVIQRTALLFSRLKRGEDVYEEDFIAVAELHRALAKFAPSRAAELSTAITRVTDVLESLKPANAVGAEPTTTPTPKPAGRLRLVR